MADMRPEHSAFRARGVARPGALATRSVAVFRSILDESAVVLGVCALGTLGGIGLRRPPCFPVLQWQACGWGAWARVPVGRIGAARDASQRGCVRDVCVCVCPFVRLHVNVRARISVACVTLVVLM